MALPQTVITYKMVLDELIKAGINKEIADDLAYRYYKNELTFKDLEFIKNDLKSDIHDLDNKIDTVENNLNNKIDNVKTELKSDIHDLDNKINTVENNLNNKIDNVKT
ncbi:hypothetical protein KZ870_33825, partial [Pseudomonas aeruginosa]|nr:hypothetical protein [Pseudomonas aeruginosa]